MSLTVVSFSVSKEALHVLKCFANGNVLTTEEICPNIGRWIEFSSSRDISAIDGDHNLLPFVMKQRRRKEKVFIRPSNSSQIVDAIQNAKSIRSADRVKLLEIFAYINNHNDSYLCID